MERNWRMEYERVLDAATEMALATSADGVPNVRIVGFCRVPDCPGTVYFSTDRTNDKVLEFARNDRVAFTTIPKEGTEHVRTRDATVRKSERSIDDMKALFLERLPGFDEVLEAIGDALDVYEIHVREAVVVLGLEEPGRVNF